ncbi:hypothetical protein POJ06DRAFT_249581 [Lipomyces tetrasporus]|uniref:Uncharacterized protein n=1 Tax=Lipomyces tetrasporus TaxID=54092 RepID=A0AAD7QW87_9ASCO|nr:uncharacterized protein POJ06DRAFT_249581 [Lipomyces tetrasporus]KAJ8102391.1 hypothetical protein POJ06DRAFT_249581 [Lipomyces tetrasporus]
MHRIPATMIGPISRVSEPYPTPMQSHYLRQTPPLRWSYSIPGLRRRATFAVHLTAFISGVQFRLYFGYTSASGLAVHSTVHLSFRLGCLFVCSSHLVVSAFVSAARLTGHLLATILFTTKKP